MVPKKENSVNDELLKSYSVNTVKNYIKHFDSYELDLAANEILDFAIKINLYLNEKQPWILIKDIKNVSIVSNIIYNVLESTRIIGLLLLPLLPDLSKNIDSQLGSLYKQEKSWNDQLGWGLLKHESILPCPTPIINKLEYE